jgi:hypothetical protein
LVTALVVGCASAKYEELSDLHPYSDLIGTRYRVRRDLRLLGITRDLSDRPRTDYYKIEGPPGTGGPEVVERRVLRAGALLKVVKIMRCTNCLDSIIRIEVDVIPDQDTKGTPVALNTLGVLLEDRGHDRPPLLNPDFLEPVAD